MRHICFSFFWMALTLSSFGQARTVPYGTPYFWLTANHETVDWRRDVYREIDLMENANKGLAYKESADSENLFERIFRLLLTGKIKAYEFSLDGRESFDDSHIRDIKEILDDFHIFYDEDSTGVTVDDMDMPTDDVLMYYMKEMMFHDSSNSMFGKTPLALCPVLVKDDDEMGLSRYPMFWVTYDDLLPYLHDIYICPNRRNMIDRLPLADYFTRNMYDGRIYRDNSDAGISLDDETPDEELKILKGHSFNIFTK